MANLPETPQWEEGVYQIEVSDPVLGGPDGISNRQAKQLASRTSYLKQKVEKGGTDLAAHIAAPDPHTQYAPKASPTFTGTPTAPTPANSDNSKKLATTEFVAKALAALAGSAPEALDTLKELADALGNDPNFATTVLNKLAEKLAKDQNGADIPNPALFVKNLGLGDGSGRLVNVQLFTSSGIYTPTAGAKFIIVEAVGGGAGGGGSSSPTANLYSAAGGGVSGSYGKAKFPAPSDPVSVTIGAAGAGGAAGTSASGTAKEGAPGGDTTLGTLLRCPGGKMSRGSNSFPANSVCSSEFSSSADAPNVDASGILLEKVHGAVSTPGIIMGTFLISGRGADSPLGRGGIPRYRSGNDLASGADGLGYGAGGGGACSGSGQQGMPGGSGTQGCLIVWEYA